MADQVFRSIAAEGKRIPTWDVETILTRAVYRALNNNCQFTHVLDNSPINVDKSVPSTDAQLQLRLVAEKLCKRVERRYEKKLLQQRERDRAETDRKLNDIRNEYSEQVEVRRRDLERERIRLEDEFVEKERSLRQKIELQLAEKESALEITRKSLETRLAELTITKEHLDRIKSDFQAKYASDIDTLNREWERLSGKKSELRAVFQREFEVELHQLKEELLKLEEENTTLKKKISDSGTELFEMRSKLSKLAVLEKDLQIANERLRKEMEENHQLSRYKYESERLREENALMKEEIEQLRAFFLEPKTMNSLSKPSVEVYQLKITELKTVIRMMSEKITSLSSERDYLREMLRCARKDVFRDTVNRGKEQHNGGVFTSVRSRKLLRDTDSSEDTSVSSSALSECASDLRLIQERFSTLENLAKTLDTTVNCVAAAHSLTHDQLGGSPILSLSENYDDFCRSLKNTTNTSYSSPLKTATKKIQRNQSLTHPLTPHLQMEQDPKDDETPRAEVPSSSPYKAITTIHQVPVPNVEAEKSTTITPVRVVKETPPDLLDANVAFTEKLKARSEASRKLKFSSFLEEEELPVLRQNIPSSNVDSTDTKKYMAVATKDGEHIGQRSSLKVEDPSASGDVLFEIDEIYVDKPLNSDDEIEW
ncbi:hypothetical protein RB195_017955 [Necator americanus]|uniref:Uncharacterized protein n=1 Tax=Necator americanus TaxID=51031 RepID=A0ABR1C950_NECAM